MSIPGNFLLKSYYSNFGALIIGQYKQHSIWFFKTKYNENNDKKCNSNIFFQRFHLQLWFDVIEGIWKKGEISCFSNDSFVLWRQYNNKFSLSLVQRLAFTWCKCPCLIYMLLKYDVLIWVFSSLHSNNFVLVSSINHDIAYFWTFL